MVQFGLFGGHTIALPETRELDLLARIVVETGGVAYRCPFVSICDAPDPGPIVAWLNELAQGDFDDLILLTGEGLSRLMTVAQRTGLEEPVRRALGQVRTISRGPKPARALRSLGLRPTLFSGEPTTDGVIATLASENLSGRRIGVQLYGEEPNDKLTRFLRDAGANIRTFAPYVYVPGPDAPLIELIDRMAAGSIAAIAFTSASQVHRLWELADRLSLQTTLGQGLGRTWVAAVGPLVAAALESKGAKVDVVPDRSFFMRPLVNDLAAFLGCQARPTARP